MGAAPARSDHPRRSRQWTVELRKTKHARGALYGHQSIKHGLNFVRGVFAAAVEDELIQTNPAEGVKPPKRRKGEQQDDWTALEPREIKRLLSHPELTFEQRSVFSLAIYTALREGEIAALLRTDVVDLDGADPHLTVTKSWTDVTTKTGKGRRVSRIPAAVKLLHEVAHAPGVAATRGAAPAAVRSDRPVEDTNKVRTAAGY